MNDDEKTGMFWEQNAEAWTTLSRKGYDIYRDHVNTPAFLKMLPAIAGLRGLDVGCGEGHNTRLLAKQGAFMTGIDISAAFIRHARAAERGESPGIEYYVASAHHLPFGNERFDFVTAFMSLMDMPGLPAVLSEIYRILKAGGFFQFSITHPVTNAPIHGKVKTGPGNKEAASIAGYFDENETLGSIEEWLFSAAPAEEKSKFTRFKVPRFHRTLATWINALIDHGFNIRRIGEPVASEEAIVACPHVGDTKIAPYFLHVLCIK